jgi:DNA-binding IscR family transcriptional regulator
MQVKEIAKNQQILPEYLGQIMVLLKRGGSFTAHVTCRFILARPPEAITVREVLRA